MEFRLPASPPPRPHPGRVKRRTFRVLESCLPQCFTSSKLFDIVTFCPSRSYSTIGTTRRARLLTKINKCRLDTLGFEVSQEDRATGEGCEVMKKSLKVGIALGGLVVVIGLVSFSLFGEDVQETEFFTTEVARGSIQNTVSATGTVEPVVTVQVGSQVSGQIETLYADFNSVVGAGQLLAKLDPRTFQSTLENSQASLVSANSRVTTAEADLINAHASLANALAGLEATRVDTEKAAILFRRAEEMKEAGLISETDYDNAKATADAGVARLKQSEAGIDQVRAQILSREAGIEQAKSSVIQAQADVSRSEINLEYTNIYSPVDGVVISREVDVGQTVAASMSAPTLFLIANDLSLMRVNASIDEADIGKLSQSNQIGFTVDAYPGERFRGFIEEIRLSPSTSQNVVTYSVIIGVNNEDLKLKPGMTAAVTIETARVDDVVRVPNAALRFRPTEEVFAALGQTLPGASAAVAEELREPAASGREGARGVTDVAPEQRAALRERMQQMSPAEREQMRAGSVESGRSQAPAAILDQGDRAVVWVLEKGALARVAVRTGISDGTQTAVVGGALEPSSQVVTGVLTGTTAAAATTSSPLLPTGRRGGLR